MTKKEEKEILNADALDETLKQIQKLFGKGAVMRLGEREAVDVDAIPSGSLLLDEALGGTPLPLHNPLPRPGRVCCNPE